MMSPIRIRPSSSADCLSIITHSRLIATVSSPASASPSHNTTTSQETHPTATTSPKAYHPEESHRRIPPTIRPILRLTIPNRRGRPHSCGYCPPPNASLPTSALGVRNREGVHHGRQSSVNIRKRTVRVAGRKARRPHRERLQLRTEKAGIYNLKYVCLGMLCRRVPWFACDVQLKNA